MFQFTNYYVGFVFKNIGHVFRGNNEIIKFVRKGRPLLLRSIKLVVLYKFRIDQYRIIG